MYNLYQVEPEPKKPWYFAAPVAFFLFVILFSLVALILMVTWSVIIWKLPSFPTLEEVLMTARTILAISGLTAAYKLIEYYFWE